jgi:hypothetical protein
MVSPEPRSVAPSFARDLILATSSMVYMLEPDKKLPAIWYRVLDSNDGTTIFGAALTADRTGHGYRPHDDSRSD